MYYMSKRKMENHFMTMDKLKEQLNNKILQKIDLNKKNPLLNKNNILLLDQFLNSFNFFKKSELIFLLRNKNNLKNLHIFCPTCGKKNNFINHSIGYTKHCSTRCSSLDKNVLNKSKLTRLEKYGDENYHNINKMKQTNLKKYGVEYNLSSKETKDKIQKTNLERYGVTSILKLKTVRDKGVKKVASKEIRNKVKNTCLKKYGVSNISQSQIIKDKKKKTNLERYGVEWFPESDKYKNIFKDKDLVKQFNNNRRNTCLKKYGVEYSSQIKSMQIKRYNTMKLNKTFNYSGPENRCYKKLINKFVEVKRNYKTNLYPFACDFYIPKLDLYIEYNGYWTHGPSKYHEPFDKNNKNHINILNIWNNKSNEINFNNKKKKLYKNAIRIWTVEDPLKLETFKKNKLNYKIFYNEKQFDEWIDSL